jgi:gliding motility-associated protein GldL
MNVTEIVQSSGWKNFMAKLYGIGAAIVIVGALFKIMHWPGASLMLILGLSTEAVIFFFSAFEPLHEELDWTLVYPELAGMTDPEEIDGFREHRQMDPAMKRRQENMGADTEGNKSAGGNAALAGLATIPEVDSETFSKLGEGLTKLSSSVDNLSDISEATIATKEYFENVKSASNNVKSLSDTYQQSNESLRESSSNLSNSYEKLSSMLLNGQENISKTNNEYGNNLTSLNKNLSALNTVYELQLQDTNQHLKETKELYNGLDEMTKSLRESVDETVRYKNEISKLGNNLSALNDVYGNMLSAVNVATNK